MSADAHNWAVEGMARRHVERLVELLGVYSAEVLTERLLLEATGGELTAAQLDALTFIHGHGGCSAKSLSEGLRISIPSATRLVDRLVRKNLVNRREGGEDRRLVDLSATREGEAFLVAVRAARVDRVWHALAKLPLEERVQLLSSLERFVLAALCDEETVEECCRRCGTEHDGACVVNEAHIALVGRPIDHP